MNFDARNNEIRRLYFEENWTQEQIADWAGLCQESVCRIVNGKQALGTYTQREPQLYELFRRELIKDARKKGVKITFEITAGQRRRECIPDLIGKLQGKIVVVEVKAGPIGQRHIEQLQRYKDHFEATYAFLISNRMIPIDIWRHSWKGMSLAEFLGKRLRWLDGNPF